MLIFEIDCINGYIDVDRTLTNLDIGVDGMRVTRAFSKLAIYL
jgi:hypothetical protein